MKLFYLSLLNQINEAAAFSPEVNKSRWQCWLWTSGSPARRITFFSPLLSIHHFLLPLCPRSMTLWVILSLTEENPPIEETVQGSVLSPLAKINNREHGWSVLLLATFNTNLSHMRNISLKFFLKWEIYLFGPKTDGFLCTDKASFLLWYSLYWFPLLWATFPRNSSSWRQQLLRHVTSAWQISFLTSGFFLIQPFPHSISQCLVSRSSFNIPSLP